MARTDSQSGIPGGGTVTSVNGLDSIVAVPGPITGTGDLRLVNDQANPGASEYYGTDAGGVKGFFPIPGGSALQNNYTAVTLPTASDDNLSGYSVGSYWIFNNYATQNGGVSFWECTDATTNAAIWLPVSNACQFNGAPTVNDDNTLGFFSNFLWFDLNSGILYWCYNA